MASHTVLIPLEKRVLYHQALLSTVLLVLILREGTSALVTLRWFFHLFASCG